MYRILWHKFQKGGDKERKIWGDKFWREIENPKENNNWKGRCVKGGVNIDQSR